MFVPRCNSFSREEETALADQLGTVEVPIITRLFLHLHWISCRSPFFFFLFFCKAMTLMAGLSPSETHGQLCFLVWSVVYQEAIVSIFKPAKPNL